MDAGTMPLTILTSITLFDKYEKGSNSLFCTFYDRLRHGGFPKAG